MLFLRTCSLAVLLGIFTFLIDSTTLYAVEFARLEVSGGDQKATLSVGTEDSKLEKIPLNRVFSLIFHFVPKVDEARISPKNRSNLEEGAGVARESGSGVGAGALVDYSQFKLLGFGAQMPEHGHGMVVTPVITELGQGKWRVDGIKMHMKGLWEILFTVSVGGVEEKFVVKYKM